MPSRSFEFRLDYLPGHSLTEPGLREASYIPSRMESALFFYPAIEIFFSLFFKKKSLQEGQKEELLTYILAQIELDRYMGYAGRLINY